MQSWIQRLEPRFVRMGFACTGATTLQASSATNGYPLATHRLGAKRLEAGVNVEVGIGPKSIFVESGKFWSSAGMLARVDLALAIIEADLSRQLALDISRFMMMVLRRQSDQSKYSAQPRAKTTEDPRIRRVQLRIWENPEAPLSLGAFAKVAAMSERSSVRRFKEVTRKTIYHCKEEIRLHLACRLLESFDKSIKSIA